MVYQDSRLQNDGELWRSAREQRDEELGLNNHRAVSTATNARHLQTQILTLERARSAMSHAALVLASFNALTSLHKLNTATRHTAWSDRSALSPSSVSLTRIVKHVEMKNGECDDQ